MPDGDLSKYIVSVNPILIEQVHLDTKKPLIINGFFVLNVAER
ncbi:hypothetical protein VIBHAR_05458 [Vibrio campbellii ATCC BAA-1116]|uniref:Uncharacterized protein n=1 Tax=Vibrio campbellii (strain ATCC BAA-1116) TaxID=2902295 RepID=A7N2P3_VIBC1|nr:hypothetical protein VIBHAR_05458 [Vibrio campbellii ATCC BAA-1116]